MGTVYPFGNVTYNPSNIDSKHIDLSLDGVLAQFRVRLDGYCTVEGYCHFTYGVDDPVGLTTVGSIVAEGPLSNPNMMTSIPCSALEVTGGTGIFTASTGMVMFCPSILNAAFSPPLVESLPPGQDLFEDADGYLHIIDMNLDEEFVYYLA